MSPLQERLLEQAACFGEKLGWERPNWFAPAGVTPTDAYSCERQNWFSYVGAEHVACRERVALFDETSFAKFELHGKDAERALQWICANDISKGQGIKAQGSLTHTQMLNARGGIQCDLTVARLAENAFYIVTGTGFATHDFHWIQRNIPAAPRDVTSAWCVLALMGPRARDVLATVTSADVANAAFPFGVRGANCALVPCTIRAENGCGGDARGPIPGIAPAEPDRKSVV